MKILNHLSEFMHYVDLVTHDESYLATAVLFLHISSLFWMKSICLKTKKCCHIPLTHVLWKQASGVQQNNLWLFCFSRSETFLCTLEASAPDKLPSPSLVSSWWIHTGCILVWRLQYIKSELSDSQHELHVSCTYRWATLSEVKDRMWLSSTFKHSK